MTLTSKVSRGDSSVIYTHPEVAAVGLTEEEARKLNIPILVGKFSFKANSRARCSGEEEGFVKLIADKKTGTLLGAHIISAHAGELIAETTLAIERKTTAQELAMTFALECYLFWQLLRLVRKDYAAKGLRISPIIAVLATIYCALVFIGIDKITVISN